MAVQEVYVLFAITAVTTRESKITRMHVSLIRYEYMRLFAFLELPTATM